MDRSRLILPIIAATLAASACGDPTGSSAVAGHYRLVSVDGQPLPYVAPPSTGFGGEAIHHGDLLLRGDRTFRIGIAGAAGSVAGTFRLNGGEIRLMGISGPGDSPGAIFSGLVDGDSIGVDAETATSMRRYVFRRAQRDPVAVSPGIHSLTAINGRGEPLTSYDTVIDGNHYVTRVLFDSLEFVDAVFYRRHRSEVSVVEDATGTPLATSSTTTRGYGGYGGSSDVVVLRPYWRAPNEPWSDTLAVVGSALVRTTPLIGRTLVERYERRP